MRVVALLLAVFVALALATEEVRFDNYKVFRVTPNNEEQVKVLRDLEATGGYSYWSEVGGVKNPVDIMVPPHLLADFKDVVQSTGIFSELFMDNVQENVEQSKQKEKAAIRSVGWTDYHTLDEIYEWLDELAATYPEQVHVQNAGKSYEGRDIKGVHLTFSPNNANRSVFIEGGIHAREWISPATVTYILNQFLTSSDAAIQNLARSFDWYFFPVTNPDGYVYTFTTNRLWRKTRVPHTLLCYGADPNRNWDVYWMQGGASALPCSETYGGPSAFSENSTRVLSEYISTIAENLFGYISFHSYSQLLLIPYGHSTAHLDNYDELKAIGDKAAATLASRYGTSYTVGNIAETIYIAAGGSMDWVKYRYGTRITYTYELRDTGRYGFLLPAEQIIPTGEETLDSFITIFEEALASTN